MNRLIAAVAVATLAVSGTVAEAAKKPKKPSPRAKVYKGALTPDAGSPYTGLSGRAQLVDNKRRDSAKVRVRGLLVPGATYSWAILRSEAGGDPCAGEAVEGFTFKALTVNEAGNAGATAKSRTFRAVSEERYAVTVADAAGTVVACGELKRKAGGKKRPARSGKGKGRRAA